MSDETNNSGGNGINAEQPKVADVLKIEPPGVPMSSQEVAAHMNEMIHGKMMPPSMPGGMPNMPNMPGMMPSRPGMPGGIPGGDDFAMMEMKRNAETRAKDAETISKLRGQLDGFRGQLSGVVNSLNNLRREISAIMCCQTEHMYSLLSPGVQDTEADWASLSEDTRGKYRAIAAFWDGIEIPPDMERNDRIRFLAEKYHDDWVQKQVDDGWSFGSTLDVEKKINPRLCSFNGVDSSYEKLLGFQAQAYLCVKGLI